MSDYKPLQFWRPGAGGADGGRGRVCLCACVARVGVRVCGYVRPDAGYMSGGSPSVRDLALDKPLLLPGVRIEALDKFNFFFLLSSYIILNRE